MTSVYCFSGSGHSYAIAEYFARELQVPVVNIDRRLAESHYQADLAVVIFPVYCQNIPAVVRDFFSKLDSKHVVLIATYGKISHGNVLWEAFKIIRGRRHCSGVRAHGAHLFGFVHTIRCSAFTTHFCENPASPGRYPDAGK